MTLARTLNLATAFAVSVTLSGCVFDLSSDEPADKPKVRIADECPPRDEANWAKMQAYLDANKTKPGMKMTESGLQYVVLQPGTGARSPTWASTVQVRYRGTFIDGTVFDETKPNDPPAEFEAGGVIKGWQEALTMMKENEKWQVVIPSGLAYGCKGRGAKIKGDQVLVFEMELIKIK